VPRSHLLKCKARSARCPRLRGLLGGHPHFVKWDAESIAEYGLELFLAVAGEGEELSPDALDAFARHGVRDSKRCGSTGEGTVMRSRPPVPWSPISEVWPR